jgi:tubulin polyglutamylase TTLL9
MATKQRAQRVGKGGEGRGAPSQVVRFKTSFSNTVFDVMKGRGWRETESDTDWDVAWLDREWVYEVFDTMRLENWQRLNHFRNGRELCRKDLLIKNLKRKKRQLERESKTEEAEAYDFAPTTFVLPREYAM